jgi:putative oxidoreductase
MTWRSIAKGVGLWALSALLAAAFLKQGISKFDNTGGWARAFAHYGFPVWFRYLIGVMEGLGGALVLVPRLAFYGAASIGIVMIGAAGTHAFRGEFGNTPVNGLGILLAGLVAWGRWSKRYGA